MSRRRRGTPIARSDSCSIPKRGSRKRRSARGWACRVARPADIRNPAGGRGGASLRQVNLLPCSEREREEVVDRLITGGTSAEVRARAMSLDRRIVGFEHDMAADGDTIELTLTGGYRLSLSSAKPIHAEMRGGGPQQLPKRRRWWRGGPR